jgi:hypothetical protein
MITRRKLIRTATLLAPFLVVPMRADVFAFARKIKDKSYKTLALFLNKYPQEMMDKNPNYLDGQSFAQWHNEVHPYLKTQLPKVIPPNGKIVELGVFKGESSEILKNIFGQERYMGVDLHPQCQIEGVQQADVRELADLRDGKAAFVWNDICSWKGSPRSRLSALNWAKRNLVSGGIYMDEGVDAIPSDVNYDGLILIDKGQNYTVFQKS